MEISRHAFPTPAGVDTVYLARGDVFADALSAGALRDGPVLLVPACAGVPGVVREEIQRVDPDQVVALGGVGAVCETTLQQAAGGRDTDRLGGADRYETAVLVSQYAFPDGADEVYLAGGDSPDAVAGGTLTEGPILLTRPGTLPAVTAREINRVDPDRVVVLGGVEAVSRAVLAAASTGRDAVRVEGRDRYETAVKIAGYGFGETVDTVYLARGDVYADAVTGGVLTDGPILLTPGGCEDLPDVVVTYLQQATPTAVVALGGPVAICDRVLDVAVTAAAGPPPTAPPGDGPSTPSPPGAGGGAPSDPGGESGQVELTDAAEILTAEEQAALIAYNPDSGQVRIDAGLPSLGQIRVGDVLVAGVTDVTPEGLLREVTAIDLTTTPDGQVVVYDTVQASLLDVVEDTGGELALTAQPAGPPQVTDLDGATVVDGTTGGNAPEPQIRTFAAPADIDQSLTLSLAQTWRASTTSGDVFRGEGSATLEGQVTVGARADLVVDISWGRLDRLRAVVTPYANTSVDLVLDGAFTGTVDHTFGKVLHTWTFFLGPVPIVVTDTSGVKATVTTQVDGKFTTGPELKVEVTSGFDYKDGTLTPVVDSAGDAKMRIFKPSAAVNADVSVGPESDVKFYGLVGITVGLGGYVNGGAEIIISDPVEATCSWDAGVRGEAGVVAGVELFGLNLEKEVTAEFHLSLASDEYSCLPDEPGSGGGGSGEEPGDPGSLTINNTTLDPAYAGEAYEAVLSATGGTPPYTWTLTSGQLPPGLTLSSDGTLTGTPTTPGDYTFQVTVTDPTGADAQLTTHLTVTNPNNPPGLTANDPIFAYDTTGQPINFLSGAAPRAEASADGSIVLMFITGWEAPGMADGLYVSTPGSPQSMRRLGDGYIFAIDDDGTIVAALEGNPTPGTGGSVIRVYDLATGTNSLLDVPGEENYLLDYFLVMSPNGRFLVSSGACGFANYCLYLYDRSDGSWRTIEEPPGVSYSLSPETVTDEGLIVFGVGDSGYYASLMVYSPTVDSWSTVTRDQIFDFGDYGISRNATAEVERTAHPDTGNSTLRTRRFEKSESGLSLIPGSEQYTPGQISYPYQYSNPVVSSDGRRVLAGGYDIYWYGVTGNATNGWLSRLSAPGTGDEELEVTGTFGDLDGILYMDRDGYMRVGRPWG